MTGLLPKIRAAFRLPYHPLINGKVSLQAIAELHNSRDDLLCMFQSSRHDGFHYGRGVVQAHTATDTHSESHEALASDTTNNTDQIIAPATIRPKVPWVQS